LDLHEINTMTPGGVCVLTIKHDTSELKPSAIKFFLDGYKPALAFDVKTQEEGIRYLRKLEYPYTKAIQSNMIFFQTKEAMEEFEKAVRRGRGNSKYFDPFPLLADALGLPPSAIEATRTPGKKCLFTIDYFGIAFRTSEELVHENLVWLKRRYPIPKNYPGKIEVVDARERVFRVKSSDINTFKPLSGDYLFANRSAPIFLITTNSSTTGIPMILYNGNDIRKASHIISRNKEIDLYIEVWSNDKFIKSYTNETIHLLKQKYGIRKNQEEEESM